MKVRHLTGLFYNQVVATVLLLVVAVPVLFSTDPSFRTHQMTAFGLMGMVLAVVAALRSKEPITLERIKAYLTTGPNLAILGLLSWTLFCTAVSSDRFYSQLSVVQLVFGVVLYFAVVYQFRHRDQVRALLKTTLLVGVGLVLLALWKAQKSSLWALAGGFHDRQLFGAFLGLMLPVAVGITTGTRDRTWKMVGQLGSILIAGGLLLTQCRSAWMGAATATVTFVTLSLLFSWNLRSLRRRKHEVVIGPILAVAVLAAFLGFTRMGGAIQGRLSTIASVQDDASIRDRVDKWAIALDVIRLRPLQGWGPGTYPLAQAEIATDSRPGTIVRQLGPSLSESPHNTYLQLAGEIGIVGVVLHLAVLVMFFINGMMALPRLEKGLRQSTLIGSMAAMTGYLVDAFANPAWVYPEVATFFWLVLGIGMSAAGVAHLIPQARKTAQPEGEPQEEFVPPAPRYPVPVVLLRGARTGLILCLALWGCSELWTLNQVAAAPNDGSGPTALSAGQPPRPTYCDHITKLGLDYRNDIVGPPAAFNIRAGAISRDRNAIFHVYALTDDPRFYANVTHERRRIKVKLHGLKGKVFWSDAGREPRFFFRPARSDRARTGTIEFSYTCTGPTETFKTTFTLTVLPNSAPIDSINARLLDERPGLSDSSLFALPGLMSIDSIEEDATP